MNTQPPRPTILIVDDTPANIQILAQSLNADYHVFVATSGADAFEVLSEQGAPDLILLDVLMPEMDGYEVRRRLRDHPQWRDIPVIFVTALSDVEAETQGLALGASDFLTKPVNIPVARLRIANLLEREAMRHELELHRDRLEEQVRQRTLSLSIAKEASEAANRLKESILRNLNHELRTPMNSIMGMLTLSRQRATDTVLQAYLIDAETSARRLLNTMTSLLDTALVAAGRLTLDDAPFVVADVLAHCRTRALPDAEAKGLGIAVTLPPELQQTRVQGDAARLGQAIDALLNNAVKFSAHGQIALSASLQPLPHGQATLLIEVADQGIGIAREDLHRIFDAFAQVDDTATRPYEGSGLGLTLARDLVRCMGGDLTVTSEPGQGSTFQLHVTVRPVDSAADAHTPRRDAAEILCSRYANLAVLVVDNDAHTRNLISDALEQVGMYVLPATNGSEAMAAAKTLRFSLLLIDLALPDMTGAEVALATRTLNGYAKTPMIAMTSPQHEVDRQECLRAGLRQQLQKPLSVERLYDAVLGCLEAITPPAP